MQKLNLALAALVALLAAGCSTTAEKTFTAKVQYAPQRQGALSSVKPKAFLIQVNDERPPDEKSCILKWKGSSMDPTWIAVTKDPPPQLVRDALKQELETNGHRVVSDTAAKPDANVTIGLKRFFGTLSGRSKVAEINAEVMVARGADRPASGSFPVSGNFKKTHNAVFAVISADPSQELSAALADFIHNLTLDPRFLEPLQ